MTVQSAALKNEWEDMAQGTRRRISILEVAQFPAERQFVGLFHHGVIELLACPRGKRNGQRYRPESATQHCGEKSKGTSDENIRCGASEAPFVSLRRAN